MEIQGMKALWLMGESVNHHPEQTVNHHIEQAVNHHTEQAVNHQGPLSFYPIFCSRPFWKLRLGS